MELNSPNNETRKMMDTLVAGYLGRQKYWESLKCLMNESSILHAAQCGGMSIILGDTVHGKHLEEIIILFNEYGNFGLNPGLLDFGVRLRSLANEFTLLTSTGVHWSDAQKLFYGKHSVPSRNHSQQTIPVTAGELSICDTNQNMIPAASADSMTSISSHHSNGSASARRKCTQPVSINTRRREFVKEVVEPVVHTAQQIINNGNGSVTDLNSSLSGLSVITIDENAVGTLDRCMAHENFAELIESIEKDFPDGFFDSFPNSDNAECLHETVFDVVSSQSNEAQQEYEQTDGDGQNMYNIPHSIAIEDSKPLCFSTPTKLKTQEKFSTPPESFSPRAAPNLNTSHAQPKTMRKKSVVAENALFRDRVEVECPFMPVEESKKVIDDLTRDLFLSSENSAKSCDDSFGKAKSRKLEISAGWRKLAELCDESNKKGVENVEQKKTPKSENLETYQTTDQKPKDNRAKFPLSTDSETRKKVRNEVSIPSSADSNADITTHQMEKYVEVEVQNAKSSSKSYTEREIELLFEDLDEQDCGNLRIQKADEWKFLSFPHFVSTRENNKGSEDRDEISGGEDSTSSYCERQASTKSILDKKKRKPKQKVVGNDFSDDIKVSGIKKKQFGEMCVSAPLRDTERQGHGSVAAKSPSYKISDQYKKQEKLNKLEEKKKKEFVMKKEKEEIERQKREVEEKELKRAAERERKRREVEEREAREKEQREKRRKEREDREKLKRMKETENKLNSSCELKKQRERSVDRKSKKDQKSAFQLDSRSEDGNEASILDRLFGNGDSLKLVMKISDKEEAKGKSDENRTRSSLTQKNVGKIKLVKEDCRTTKEKLERCGDSKLAKYTKESGSSQLDVVDDFFIPVVKSDTLRKEKICAMESKSCKIAMSGINKGRENLLVGGGHSARVGMVLEKATRIRTKYEHEEKLKQEYRKVEGIRRTSVSSSEHTNRKRILETPISKTDLFSQLLKSDSSAHNDSLRRSVSAKNINSCSEAIVPVATLKIPVSSKSTTAVCSSCSDSSGSKSLHHGELSGISFPTVQVKKPRLDMAAIDAVLQTLHGLDKDSSSSSFSASS